MRKIKDILRLRYEAGLPYRGIANALNIGYGTVVDYLNRAQRAGLGWPVPEGMHERDLGRLLFPTQAVTGQRRFAEPDFPEVCRELKRKGVTKLLLWQEYRQVGAPSLRQRELPGRCCLELALHTGRCCICAQPGYG
jgi:hypothetical protein